MKPVQAAGERPRIMFCKYCGNPIGLYTGVRLGGFCEPRHAALFQACERIAGREPEGFFRAAVEARSIRSVYALPPVIDFFRGPGAPAHSPRATPVVLPTAPFGTRPAEASDRDAEASANATAVWSPRAAIPAANQRIDSCRGTLRADWRYATPRRYNIVVRPLPPDWIGRGAIAALDPAEFSVPAAAICTHAADLPRLAQPMARAIRRAPDRRDRAAQPCPPSAITVEPSPVVRPPQFRPQSRQRDPVPVRPLCGYELFPQFPCQRPPEFPAPEASAFPSRLEREGLRRTRLGNNLVVMPHPGGSALGRMRGGRPADCQPAATTLRAFRLQPLPASASPSFAMDPCEFPPAGERVGV